jgi:hypothetical protein
MINFFKFKSELLKLFRWLFFLTKVTFSRQEGHSVARGTSPKNERKINSWEKKFGAEIALIQLSHLPFLPAMQIFRPRKLSKFEICRRSQFRRPEHYFCSIKRFHLIANHSSRKTCFQYRDQGCQICLHLIYQNGGKIYQTATKLPNGHKIY